MAVCVKCKSPVPESAFGIYTCGACQSVLAIDFDGNITLSEDKLNELSPSFGESVDPTMVLGAKQVSEKVALKETTPTPSRESTPVQAPEAVHELIPELPDDRPPYELDPASKPSSEPNFNDIVDFANSELSQGTKGNFLYDVLIKGIDSEDLRFAVKEALQDKRFAWDAETTFRKIRGGSIKIEKINSVKASILINRLKGYPLEISWVQNGLLEVTP